MKALTRQLAAAFITLTTVVGEDANPPLPRGVYALVIGVTEYEIPLAHGASRAKEFIAHVRNAFPNATIWKHLDVDATRSKVLERLHGGRSAGNNAVKNIPPGSLLIIYYCGHGKRVEYGQNSSSLYLPLYKASHQDYFGSSVSLSELHQGVLSSKGGVFVMSFLDCCFSGGTPENITENLQVQGSSIGVRGFLLASSSSVEQSIGGHFTKALLQAWKDSRGQLTPPGLEKAVRGALDEKVEKYMTVNLAYGYDLRVPVARLDERSAAVFFEFTGNKIGSIRVYLGEDTEYSEFKLTRSNRLLTLVLPQDQINLRLVYNSRDVRNGNLDLRDLATGYHEEILTLPGDVAVLDQEVTPVDLEMGYQRLAAITAVGANPAREALRLARLRTALDPGAETESLLRTAIATAAEGSDERQLARIALGELEFDPAAHADPRTILSEVQRVGGFEVAGQGYLASAFTADRAQASFFLEQAAKSNVIAKNFEALESIHAAIDSDDLELSPTDGHMVKLISQELFRYATSEEALTEERVRLGAIRDYTSLSLRPKSDWRKKEIRVLTHALQGESKRYSEPSWHDLNTLESLRISADQLVPGIAAHGALRNQGIEIP